MPVLKPESVNDSPPKLSYRTPGRRNQEEAAVIDSLNGFMNAMGDEGPPAAQIHQPLSYLTRKRLTCIVVLCAKPDTLGPQCTAPLHVNYLAANVVLSDTPELRAKFEKLCCAVKMRGDDYEDYSRELSFAGSRITVGDALGDFRECAYGSSRLHRDPPLSLDHASGLQERFEDGHVRILNAFSLPLLPDAIRNWYRGRFAAAVLTLQCVATFLR